MFRLATSCGIALLLATGTIAFMSLGWPHPEDKAAYIAQTQLKAKFQSQKNANPPPAHQVRNRVQKDLWRFEGTNSPCACPVGYNLRKVSKTHHVRIEAQDSEIWIQQMKHKFEIKEQLHAMIACTQDYQNALSQEVRWMTAKEGFISIPSYHFEATDVQLSTFQLEGNACPLQCPLQLPLFSVGAHHAELQWPGAIKLTHEVQLFSSQSEGAQTFVLADELSFHPSDEYIELGSYPSKRVLCWQGDPSNRTFSAPQMRIRRDATTKNVEIQAIGDTRLHLNPEEAAEITRIFGK